MALHIEVELLDSQISVFILTHIVVLAHFDGKYTNFLLNSQRFYVIFRRCTTMGLPIREPRPWEAIQNGYRHVMVWVKAYNEKMSFLSLIVLMLHLVRLNARPNGYGYCNRCQTQTGITDDYSQPGNVLFPAWESSIPTLGMNHSP